MLTGCSPRADEVVLVNDLTTARRAFRAGAVEAAMARFASPEARVDERQKLFGALNAVAAWKISDSKTGGGLIGFPAPRQGWARGETLTRNVFRPIS